MAELLKKNKQELEETDKKLYLTLPDQLKELTTTKEELEEFKQRLIEQNIPENIAAVEAEKYNIRKRLNYLLSEAGIHEEIEIAIKVLDAAIDTITKENENNQS